MALMQDHQVELEMVSSIISMIHIHALIKTCTLEDATLLMEPLPFDMIAFDFNNTAYFYPQTLN